MAKWAGKNLIVPDGHVMAGHPLILPKFAIKFLRKAIKHRISFLSTARKQAKSTIIATYMLTKLLEDSPVYQRGFRAGVVSLTEKHSREVYLQVRDISLASGYHEVLKFRDSPPRRIETPHGSVEFLSADRATGHSAGYDLVLIDEIGLMNEKDRPLIVAMRTSTLAKQGRLIAISVYGDSPFSKEYEVAARSDPDIYVKIYRAPDKCELDDPSAIAKANPGLKAKILDLNTLLAEARLAKAIPAEEHSFRQLVLNQRGYGELRETLLTLTDFQVCLVDKLPERKGDYFLGIDRGESESLSALFSYWPETGRAEYLAIIGNSVSIPDRERRDDVSYSAAIKAGECLFEPQAVPDFEDFLRAGLERFGGIPRLTALDNYRKQDTAEILKDVGIPASRTEWVIMGPRGDPNIRAFRRMVRQGMVKLAKPAILFERNIEGVACGTNQIRQSRNEQGQPILTY